MGEFKSLVPPVSKRPRSNFFGPASNWTVRIPPSHYISIEQASSITLQLLRDQFAIPTWLAIGGALQGFCFLTIDRISLLPAFILLLYRVLDTYAQAVGLKHNSSMDNVDPRKVSAQPPDELGNYGSQPASQDMVVLLIGARSNHAYGALAPRFKDIGDFFRAMAEDLDSHADEFGFLGMTSWLNITDRTSNNESMNVAYFRSVEGLHAFAHSKYHRVGWDYWNKHAADCKHISIWHEVYHAPKGHWEK